MIRGLYAAAAGLSAYQTQSDLVAHNLANVGTVGFRRHEAIFSEVLDAATAGVQTGGTLMPDRPGPILRTGRPLDAAIFGPGFFRLIGPDGDRFTRAGRFSVAADGTVVGPGGLAVAGLNGPIVMPSDAVDLTVAETGAVLAHRVGQPPETLDRLALAVPANASAMQPSGENLWQALAPVTLAAPGEGGTNPLSSNAVEGGNVDMAEEMAALIQSVRFYQFNSRAVQAADDITGTAIEMWRP